MKLQDFAFVNPKEKLDRGQAYPFVEMADIIAGNRYVRSSIEKAFAGSCTKFRDKDTLLARITPCLQNGKISQYKSDIAGQKAFGSTEFFIFREREGVSDSSYLFYLINSSIVRDPAISSMSGATGRQRAHIDVVKNIDVPDFSLSTQKKIAGILSAYDDLIENNNRRIQILEEMAQKLYKHWFVDFKFPNHENTQFVESELGLIPEGWKVKKAKQVSDILIGRTPPRKESHWFSLFSAGNKKWISIKDMGSSRLYISQTSEYLTSEAILKKKVPLIPKDTIIVSFKLTVGKVAITDEEMCSNEAIAQFPIKPESGLTTLYLYSYLNNFEYKSLGNTSSIGNAINSTILKNMLILVPEQTMLTKFTDLLEPIFNQIKNLSNESRNLSQTRDMLLPKLISGELDVSELEVKV